MDGTLAIMVFAVAYQVGLTFAEGMLTEGMVAENITMVDTAPFNSEEFPQLLTFSSAPNSSGLVIVTRPTEAHSNELLVGALYAPSTIDNFPKEATGLFFPTSGVESVFLRLYNSMFGDVKHFKDIYIKDTTGLYEFNLTSGYNSSRKSIFYFHGFTKSAEKTTKVPAAFVSRDEYNVFSVDWSELAQPPYTYAVQRMKAAGYAMAEFLNLAISNGFMELADITLIGHSLGAHLAGYVGRNLISKPPVIIGLDPAGPEFYSGFLAAKLTKSDADNVYYLQTNMYAYGLALSLGKSNYIFNYPAFLQPGCRSVTCSHSRAVDYFAEAVLNSKSMVAVRCNSPDEFKSGSCSNDLSFIGFPVDNRAEGTYYLKTNPRKPYGRGVIGIKST